VFLLQFEFVFTGVIPYNPQKGSDPVKGVSIRFLARMLRFLFSSIPLCPGIQNMVT